MFIQHSVQINKGYHNLIKTLYDYMQMQLCWLIHAVKHFEQSILHKLHVTEREINNGMSTIVTQCTHTFASGNWEINTSTNNNFNNFNKDTKTAA